MRKNPAMLLYRSEQPIFVPEKEWEKVGQVPNVVFGEGMVDRRTNYVSYYSGADKHVGVAEALKARSSRQIMHHHSY